MSRIQAPLFCLTLFCVGLFSSSLNAQTMTELTRVKLQTLDKITAETITFEAEVGSTLKFGPLYIKVQTCQKSSPLDEPESAAFVQVWEIDQNEESKWVFSGWMFASSPGLSAMNHAIYDVWVIDCLDREGAQSNTTENETEAPAEEPKESVNDDLLQE